MIRGIRHTAAFSFLLLTALLVNAVRVQVFEAEGYTGNPANRRTAIARYAQPRGAVVVGGHPVTGSRDSGGRLRYERTYTDGPLYAPLTGFASQQYGTSLLESSEDGILAGTDDRLVVFPWWDGLVHRRPPGGRVETTVNPAMQRAAYHGLAGRKGAVVAVEPRTGRVLALVSSPSYDPGELSGNGRSVTGAWRRLNEAPDRPMLNRALRQTYPPGSVFKVVTAAAALDSGLVKDLDAPLDVPDPYTLPGTRTQLGNPTEGCEHAGLREAFRLSCNTVFARLGVGVGERGMAEAAQRFGFNDRGLRIPSPVAPSTFDTRMPPAQLALSAIGQYDTAATPMQMAMVAAAVANDGQLTPPYLVERVTDAHGVMVATGARRPTRQVMNPATAEQLQEMMAEVVEHGSGRTAAIDGFIVGGKTGTAQHGVRNEGTPYAWFIAWVRDQQSHEPLSAVAVVVEDAEAEREDISGGGSAGPIARAVMAAGLR
ncbi:penicillin-binding transpeptidase domain-containing protein [Streptomyces noursei]|uniref:penicillin-binding transpeptidase domain-containing protein n=1 Tax=Streptomyces noursei TaxID=1971 RepID=UPI00167B0CE1|nr:penicillin-binding transpeptidase domain-containing protein [Streptomyces noursei]MCZ1018034.1 penicillin-binding transpeptidase domain-containing protein [Streptomyces noursei]GGW86150.1 penicillin-binding protein [Streptomyces noursei]